MQEEADPIEGSLGEPEKASALHYRLVANADRPRIAAIVDQHILALKATTSVTQ